MKNIFLRTRPEQLTSKPEILFLKKIKKQKVTPPSSQKESIKKQKTKHREPREQKREIQHRKLFVFNKKNIYNLEKKQNLGGDSCFDGGSKETGNLGH